GRLCDDRVELRDVECRRAVVVVEAVPLLLDVGQLRVAETEEGRVLELRVAQPLEALEPFRLALRSVAVAPVLRVALVGPDPADPAELAHEEGAVADGNVISRRQREPLATRPPARTEAFRVLVVVVRVVDVAPRIAVDVAARVEHRSRRIERT